MKQPKKLTRSQKSNVSANGLNPNDWMFSRPISDSYYEIVHKATGKTKIIDKFRKKELY